MGIHENFVLIWEFLATLVMNLFIHICLDDPQN